LYILNPFTFGTVKILIDEATSLIAVLATISFVFSLKYQMLIPTEYPKESIFVLRFSSSRSLSSSLLKRILKKNIRGDKHFLKIFTFLFSKIFFKNSG